MVRTSFDASKLTVLCVDDDLGVLQAVQRTLHSLGLQIMTAQNGEAGLAKLADQNVHVLICDASMPGMGGIELMRQATQLAPNVPRILLTAHANTKDVLMPAITDCAVFRIIPKPWNQLALRLAVVEALGFTAKEWETQTGKPLNCMDACLT